jgi:hypothetical protein
LQHGHAIDGSPRLKTFISGVWLRCIRARMIARHPRPAHLAKSSAMLPKSVKREGKVDGVQDDSAR